MSLRGIFDCGGVRKQNGHWQSSNLIKPGPVTGGNIHLLSKVVSAVYSYYTYRSMGVFASYSLQPGHKYHIEYKIRIDNSVPNCEDVYADIHRTMLPQFSGYWRFTDGNGNNLQWNSNTFYTPAILNTTDVDCYSTYSSTARIIAKITNIHLDNKFTVNDNFFNPDIYIASYEGDSSDLVGEYVIFSYDIEYLEEDHSAIRIDNLAYKTYDEQLSYEGEVDFDIPELGQLDSTITEIV